MITFKQFITENRASADPKFTSMGDNELKDMLQHDCEFFLKESRKQGFLVRGMRRMGRAKWMALPHPRDPEFTSVPYWENYTRQDRSPADTSQSTHKLLDEWFDSNFGIKARSQALFCMGSSDRGVKATDQYGDPYIIMPVGNFKYVWSPNVADLYGEVAGIAWDYDPDDPDNQEVDPYVQLDKFMSSRGYRTTGLSEAVRGRTEIMVGCRKYYAFELEWRPLLESLLDIK